MQREIKLRGRRIDNGEWVYGSLIGSDVIVGDILEFDDEYFNTEFWYKVDPETVGQYTGLKDTEEADMFDCDLIEHMDSVTLKTLVSEIYWRDKGYWALRDGKGKFVDLLHRAENPLVIGNIHQHPELLKEGEG